MEINKNAKKERNFELNEKDKEQKKSKKFDRKTKHKLRMESKVKKPLSDLMDYKKDLKSDKFDFYYKVNLK